MYIKLTRLDNSPLWLNAAFVVTIEPRKGGGATVVPIGDGLDYDVKESPETVLALLDGAPTPAVVPVPTSDALTPTPDDVSPETDAQLVAEARQSAAAQEPAAAEPPAEEKPAKRTRKTASTTAKKPRVSRKKKPALPLEAEDVERLSRMRPKSLKKLQNTLQSQFKIEDAASAVEALAANGVFTLEQERVIWPVPDPA